MKSTATTAVKLYADHPTVASIDLATEVTTEVRLLRAAQTELAMHAQQYEDAYHWVDPGLAHSLPGLGEVDAPVLVAAMGRTTQSRSWTFKSFTGLTPRTRMPPEARALRCSRG